jgi:hypothetical protein
MRMRHIVRFLVTLAGTGSPAFTPPAVAAVIPADPLSLEVQHRSDKNQYLASRALVTPSGLRNGFQADYGNRGGGGDFPDAGIEAVYLFKLPSLDPGQLVAEAHLSFSSLRESAATGATPTFNVDLYAVGFEKGQTPHDAPVDMPGVVSEFAQPPVHYVGPEQAGTGLNGVPIAKIQDDLLTPGDWIPNTAGVGTNAPRHTSPQADVSLAAYIRENLYGNANFQPEHDYLLLRLTPDVNAYSGAVNQRYHVSTVQTDRDVFVGMIVPELELITVPEPTGLVRLITLTGWIMRPRSRRERKKLNRGDL